MMQQNVQRAHLLRELTAPGASFAIVRAGTTPYFANRVAIDLLGKVDKRISRMAIPDERLRPVIDNDAIFGRLFRFQPGHMKWDYAYSIGELRPDVIAELPGGSEGDLRPFLQDYIKKYVSSLGQHMYFRKDSEKIRWDRLELLD